MKVGLDDYLNKYGVTSLKKLMEEAQPFDKDLPLHELNDEVVYVRCINAVVDTARNHIMRPRDFVTDVFADRRHTVTLGKDQERQISTADAWMKWPERRTAENVTFAPGRPLLFDNYLNLSRGLAAEPAEGDVKIFFELLDHVFQDAAKEKKWFLQWTAYPLQHPGTKLRTAVMMHGIVQGTGKTLLGETIAALYGDAGKLIGQEQLEREFNEYMDGAAFVVGDEVTTRGTKRETAERLKNLVTRPFATINKKYQPVYKLPNVAQFYLTSNHDDALYLEDKDRRFFVHRVENDALPPEFPKRFAQWQRDTDWKAALLHHLMYRVDCSDFDPYAPAPMTEAKQDMIATGLSDLDNWVRQLPNAPIHLDSPICLGPLHSAEELRIIAFGKDARCSVASVGLAMRKAGFERAHAAQQIKLTGRLVTLWPTVKGLRPKQLEILIAARRAAADKERLRRFGGRNVAGAAATTERVQ